jgi:predicted DCC family thiol-disulfide oxidoreductase YuxK
VNRLTVLYDGTCALCLRCRDFLAVSRTFIPLELLSCQSLEARERFGAVPWLGEELVVVSDDGDVWIGPAAFLVSMWALADYREWSYRLSGPELAPLAERFFVAISSQRRRIATLFRKPRCEDGDACALPRHAHPLDEAHAPRYGTYR